MTAVHEQLPDCADVVAEVVQRPPAGDELAQFRGAPERPRDRPTPDAQYAAL
ncbi:hypothetical protein [Streptomyces sp. NPDC006971]|uniref:hypothetical protein n=1 Tax=Streptomyces sp. NPDC006971 TaxID=3154784 RepID=UPI0033FD8B96